MHVFTVNTSKVNRLNICGEMFFTVCSRQAEMSSKNQYQSLFDVPGICIGCH